jgi:two-component system chemotaxis response regulator CheB
LSPRSRNYLVEILQKLTTMAVVQASEGAAVHHRTIYVTPADRHLIVSQNHIHLSRGPKEGLQRPSINATFRSAAAAYGNRVIGVLVSGLLDDGAAGILEIAKRGGITIVQDPAEAPFPSMPLNALNDAIVHHTLSVSEIGEMIIRLVQEEIGPTDVDPAIPPDMDQFSGFTCPECRGPLYEHGGLPEFRCLVGHVMSLRTLFEEHTSTQERKLYEAIVALREGAALAERMADAAPAEEQDSFRQEAQQLRRSAEIIRKLTEERVLPSADRS